jgi:ParB family transcriptional regulator, chromosome partitioning protein
MPRANRPAPHTLDRFSAGAGVPELLAALEATGGEEPGRAVPLPLDQLEACPWQPRIHMDPELLQQLVATIRHQGLLQPITVRKLSGGAAVGGARYQIVAGHRRVEAVRRLYAETGDECHATISALVRELSDLQARLVTHAENLRENLTGWEKARSVAAIRDVLRDAGEACDNDTVARFAHVANGAASECLRIADAVTVELIRESEITIGDSIDYTTVQRLPAVGLLAVARLPESKRVEALRALAAKKSLPRAPRPRVSRCGAKGPDSEAGEGGSGPRASRYTAEQLREQGGFNLKVLTPFKGLSTDQALTHLNDIVVGGAAFAEAACSSQQVTVVAHGSIIAVFIRPHEYGGAGKEAVLRELMQRLSAAMDSPSSTSD